MIGAAPYFPRRFFAARYWPKVGAVAIPSVYVPTKRDGVFRYARARDGVFQQQTKRDGVLA